MSDESLSVVREFFSAHEGSEIVSIQRDWVERFGPNPDLETVMRLWEEDPGWRYVDPEIDWDFSGAGAFGTREKGAARVYAWWVDWLQGFESYSYEVSEYREIGEWVLVPLALRATGRDGLPLELQAFQLLHVDDGRIDAMRVFFTERDAIDSALSSQETSDV